MSKKIFIACDTNKISKVSRIIKYSNTKKLKIGYKFGLEFFNSIQIASNFFLSPARGCYAGSSSG